jgi:hypothetical protein
MAKIMDRQGSRVSKMHTNYVMLYSLHSVGRYGVAPDNFFLFLAFDKPTNLVVFDTAPCGLSKRQL